MAYLPQGVPYQPPMSLPSCPPFNSLFNPGVGMDGPGWFSSGPAYAPYSSSVGSPQLYGGGTGPARTLGAFTRPCCRSPSCSLGCRPFGGLRPEPYLQNDYIYRKYARADPHETLRAWLQDHLKRPYPNRGQKVMLAFTAKMTLEEVSNWFVNARRLLQDGKKTTRKQNKADDGVMKTTDEGTQEKIHDAVHLHPASCVTSRDGSSNTGPGWPPTVPDHAPLGEVSVSEVEPMSRESSWSAIQGPNSVPQPNLWSLSGMSTPQSGGAGPQAPLWIPQNSASPQHLYYTSPFVPGYYGAVGPHADGSPQPMAQPRFQGIPAEGAAASRGLNPGLLTRRL